MIRVTCLHSSVFRENCLIRTGVTGIHSNTPLLRSLSFHPLLCRYPLQEWLRGIEKKVDPVHCRQPMDMNSSFFFLFTDSPRIQSWTSHSFHGYMTISCLIKKCKSVPKVALSDRSWFIGHMHRTIVWTKWPCDQILTLLFFPLALSSRLRLITVVTNPRPSSHISFSALAPSR